jgi:hypothetical protein
MKFLSSAFLVFSLSILLLPSSSLSYELGTDFEGGLPPGFTVDGWGIRDVSTCQYGPQIAPSGTMCVGVPDTCVAGYPSGDPADYWEAFFTTPEITLGDSFPSLYLRFTHWGDFEGVTDEFDGVILEFINVTQGTTEQIDPDAELQLIPTYDAIIPGSAQTPLANLWAYCHDTRGGAFNSLGFPYVSFTYLDPSGNPQSQVKQQTHSHSPMQFEWRAVQSVDLIAAGYAVQGDDIQIQWHFVSDQLANGAGYFVDDLYLSNTPPSDQQAPIIRVGSPAPYADVHTENLPVPVKAYVDDIGSEVLADSVFLVYTIEDNPTEVIVPMTSFAADSFSAEVEALPYDTDVYYRIVAYDNVFNKGTSPTFTFEVTDAVTFFYDDGIPQSVFPEPEVGSGFANKFSVPADTLFEIHKVMFYMAREDGLFDVVVNSGTASPGPELARFEDVTNAAFASTFFQYELPESVGVQGPTYFWVGMRHVSADTLLDPQPLVDGTKEFNGVCYNFFGGAWAEITTGETMIRVKVKKIESVGIEGDDVAGGTLPKAYALSQNFPNPFNPMTSISYDVPEKVGSGVPVAIDIFNIHGQLVKNLVNETKKPGSYTVQWNGRNKQGSQASSGIYFYRIKAGDYISTKKMLLLK